MPKPAKLMSPAEIQRALRFITAQPKRNTPINRLADLTGLSRVAIYNAVEGTVPPRVQQLLSAVLPSVLSGEPWTA